MGQGGQSDEALMRQVQQGRVAAFDALFDRHQQAVYGYLRRMVGEDGLAEDLTQDCFLRAWRARHDWRPAAPLRTWLFTIARRLALDDARRPRPPHAPLSETLPGGVSPAETLLAGELARRIECAVAQMPPELREAVILRDMEQMPYAEIAQVVGCPVGTVRSRLHAARARLHAVAREWMNEDP